MTHTAGDPYEAIVRRVAVGHVERAPGWPLEPSPVWALARSNSPAGSMLAMRPRDLVAFARMHLAEGRGPDGRSVLSSDSVRAMRQPQVALPDIGQGTAWGLGWELYDTPDGTVVGHDGNTIGQSAFLRLVPERRLALAVLTNGGRSRQVYAEVADRVLGELTELTELGELGGVRSVEATRPSRVRPSRRRRWRRRGTPVRICPAPPGPPSAVTSTGDCGWNASPWGRRRSGRVAVPDGARAVARGHMASRRAGAGRVRADRVSR